MNLRLSDLNSLLRREGSLAQATAQEAIVQLLHLRCRQLARLGKYSEDFFTQQLMIIPIHEIDNCFAAEAAGATLHNNEWYGAAESHEQVSLETQSIHIPATPSSPPRSPRGPPV